MDVASVGGHSLNYVSLGTHPSCFLVLTSGGGGVLDCPSEAGTCERALVTTRPPFNGSWR